MSIIIEKKKKHKKKDLFAMQFNSDPKANMDSFNCMMSEDTNKNFVIEAIETSKKFYNIDRNGLYSSGRFFFDLIDYCEENDIWVDWRENKDRQGNFHLTMFKIELDRQQKEDLLKEFPKLKDELRPERKSK